MKEINPQFEAAVVGIDVLDVVSPSDPLALTKVDGFVADAFRAAERPVGGVAVADQQRVGGQHRLESFRQACLGQRAVARHEIERVAGAVTHHQDTNLLVGDAGQGGAPPRVSLGGGLGYACPCPIPRDRFHRPR